MQFKKASVTLEFVDSAIVFNGNTIIDFAEVSQAASARIFSASITDPVGVSTAFSIMPSENIFTVADASLSVNEFVRAVVENRIEIDGMVVMPEIMQAYLALTNQKTLLLPLERYQLRRERKNASETI